MSERELKTKRQHEKGGSLIVIALKIECRAAISIFYKDEPAGIARLWEFRPVTREFAYIIYAVTTTYKVSFDRDRRLNGICPLF